MFLFPLIESRSTESRLSQSVYKVREVRIFDPIRDFLFIGRFSWNVQGTLEIHWTVSHTFFITIEVLLFELLRIFYFREFPILRANIWRKWPNRKRDALHDCAYLLCKFYQNRSSGLRELARTNFVTYVCSLSVKLLDTTCIQRNPPSPVPCLALSTHAVSHI